MGRSGADSMNRCTRPDDSEEVKAEGRGKEGGNRLDVTKNMLKEGSCWNWI